MTVATIEAKTRRLVGDDKEPYRWSAADIRDDIADAVRHLQSQRPSTRYVAGGINDWTLPESDAEPLPCDDRFLEALAHYAAYKCYLCDAEDTANAQLAESHLAKAEAHMRG